MTATAETTTIFTGLTVQEKFTTTLTEISESLIERDPEVELVLTALLTGAHPLLVGPPGTAKSLLLDSVMNWVSGDKLAVLFNKYTTPEEVFGPVSVEGLKKDVYRRITAGKLPEVTGFFADEIFKASTAILNTLLRVLNEGVYDFGDGKFTKVPLLICVAASNEWPGGDDGGKELAALFDRFLFRRTVKPIVTNTGLSKLLWSEDLTPKLSTTITAEQVLQARREAALLPFTSEAQEATMTILRELKKEGVVPGDRRKRLSVKAARAQAYLLGATEVKPEHLSVFADTFWDDPLEQPAVVTKVVARIANPAAMKINEMILEVEQILASTNIHNIVQAATAGEKLKTIIKDLRALGTDPRVAKAVKHVDEQLTMIRRATSAAM